MKCREIIALLERLSPPRYACDWDNVGLLVGEFEQEVHTIMLALDASSDVVQLAVERHVDMIITHHPMIFQRIQRVTDDTPLGKKILNLAQNRIACYAMHTNFDVKGSMAEVAAGLLQIRNAQVLEPTWEREGQCEGIGRVGEWGADHTAAQLVEAVKGAFQLKTVMTYGDLSRVVHRVAICPGSGRGMLDAALKTGAQVLITGDIGHHEGLDAVEAGLLVIDATHYGLEHIFVAFMEDYLKKQELPVEILACDSGSPCRFV